MASNILTDNFVNSNKTAPGRYADGDGLYLLVKPSGSKSWVLRMQSALVNNGKRMDYGLGSTKKISLQDVRALASQYRAWLAQGKSPKGEIEKLKKNPIPTFKEAATARHASLSKTLKNAKHATQWLTTLKRYAFPIIGDMKVSDIEIEHIEDVLRPIWFEKPETALKVKQRIGDVMDMAHLRRQRATELPVRKIGKLLGSQTKARQHKYREHFPSLFYEDMPQLLSRLNSAEETIGRLGLMFQILTAVRTGELRFARWSEINGDVWTIPGLRMKEGLEHKVYLSTAALDVLDRVKAFQIRSLDDLIFVGLKNGPISNGTLSKVLRLGSAGLRVKFGPVATVHGNRGTFRTWVQEQCPDVKEAVAELALSHKQSNAVIAAYNHAEFEDWRRDLMERWGTFVMQSTDNVRSIAV
ncbi:tyrosine-type recombinase/integrase [Parasphingorhabdus flavimaris]|uniref:tyrosine-type recombinase/integrase n=1 Tax=Parasphingorhabdus flavimaris TaxID=266812 RepID=UPI003003959C